MLSKNKLKFLRQLALKKHRDAEGLFLAEGPKVVGDLLPHFACLLLCATTDYLAAHPHLSANEVIEITERELQQASQLKTPRQVLAVFRQPAPLPEAEHPIILRQRLCLALDGVQDPGNVGTILRIADWMGIDHVFCSPDTADAFAPKTVQATMGALARVAVHTTDLPTLIDHAGAEIPVFATTLDGDDLYADPLSTTGLIVMGNEGNGVSAEVLRRVNRRLYIPNFPSGRATSESLNVAIATALTCGEFRRRQR